MNRCNTEPLRQGPPIKEIRVVLKVRTFSFGKDYFPPFGKDTVAGTILYIKGDETKDNNTLPNNFCSGKMSPGSSPFKPVHRSDIRRNRQIGHKSDLSRFDITKLEN
jgi:hypothetical protein